MRPRGAAPERIGETGGSERAADATEGTGRQRREHDSDGSQVRPAAIICDLDGTLVDSGLDFPTIKAELGLPPDASILEAMAGLSPDELVRCRAILDRHEHAGAYRARLLPGVDEFLALATSLGLKRGLFTRNSRSATAITLHRCRLSFDRVLTREDGPVKPDPWAINALCQGWGIPPRAALVFGDFHYDSAAGRAAGALNVLVCHGQAPATVRGHELADFCLDSFADRERVARLLHGNGGGMEEKA